MISKVQMTRLAQGQLGEYVGYIRRKFKNPQAAKAVTNDARETRKALLNVAESLDYCKDPICELWDTGLSFSSVTGTCSFTRFMTT